jgi:hypothetical protein
MNKEKQGGWDKENNKQELIGDLTLSTENS